jgi:predicted metal-dependent peptidase
MSVKLTAEQRVQKAHIAMMNDPKYCLYSGIFMMGKTEVLDTGCPTAYTNGRDVKYGRKFVDKLSDPELKGLILHENLHKAFRHLTVWEDLHKQDHRRANMACDYVINLMIYDLDQSGINVKLPEGGLLDEQYRGMDAGTVFRLLKDKKGKERGKTPSDDTDESSAGDGEESLDEHGWDDAKEMSTQEREKLARDIDQALRQGALLAGKMKGNLPREITDLLDAKVDWREALREFVSSYCADKDVSTWRKPNRRWVDRDIYMPTLIGETIGRLVVAIDMSGSIGTEEIGKFLGELMSICQSVTPEGIDLLYWDTEVCQHEKYEAGQYDALLTTTKPAGGGGTVAACIPKYIRDRGIKAECCVVLTDGHVYEWGDSWPCPVLWGITTKGINAPIGTSIYINEE